MWHVRETVEVHRGIWCGDLRERYYWKYRCRREDNIKIDFQEDGWRGIDWIDLAQDRDRYRALVNAVTNLRIP